MKMRFWTFVSSSLIVMAAGTAFASDWRIFGAHGTVRITTKGGESAIVNKEKSLMMKVSDGSTIQVKGRGKVVLVSLSSRQAFEIGDNTTAVVEPETVRALNGSVNPKSGFAPPTRKDGKMGGIVMRGLDYQASCLKVLSPINTAVLELTPQLLWENSCRTPSKVSVTILSDERVVHTAEAISGSSYRIPENVLKEGSRYLWMIDEGVSFDMSSGVFRVTGGKEREELLQRMKEADSATTPEERIAYIYFLADGGFSDMAREESRKLRAAFPEASGLSELP